MQNHKAKAAALTSEIPSSMWTENDLKYSKTCLWNKSWKKKKKKKKKLKIRCNDIQGGVEPTDTFQMVIDNIWKQGKIGETVYKYIQVCYLLPTDYKLIF